jgi:hypothetical protein
MAKKEKKRKKRSHSRVLEKNGLVAIWSNWKSQKNFIKMINQPRNIYGCDASITGDRFFLIKVTVRIVEQGTSEFSIE